MAVKDAEKIEAKIPSDDLDQQSLQDSVNARVKSRVKEEL